MRVKSATRLGWMAAVAAAVATSGCGSGADATAGAAKAQPAKSTAATASTSIPNDGPEGNLPTAYQAPVVKPGTACKIGYMNALASVSFFATQQSAAHAEAQRLGCSFIALDDQASLTKQVTDFDQLIGQKVSAILVFPLVPKALAPSVAKAKAAGIPVIAASTPSDASQPLEEGYTTDVLQGFDTVAYLRAKAVAEAKPGAKYGIISYGQPVAALQYFLSRTKYWAGRFGLEFVGETDAREDNPSSTATAAQALFTRYRDLDAVFAWADTAALSAVTVAKTSGHSNVMILGNNGSKAAIAAVKNGGLFATSQPDAFRIGTQMVDAAYDLITGVKSLPEKVVTAVLLITKDNADQAKPIG